MAKPERPAQTTARRRFDIDDVTKILIAARVACIFIPQLGYIHPDEFFQTTEITAGEVLKTDSYRPWEFTTENPLRSCIFAHIFAFLPYHLMRTVGSNPYLRLCLPRVVACLLSFIVDYAVYKIGGASALKILATSYVAMVYFTRTFTNVTETVFFAILFLMSFPEFKIVNIKKSADGTTVVTDVKKTEQSPDSATKQTKTPSTDGDAKAEFETQTNKILNSRLPPASSEFWYMTVIVLGVFNRPTFLCFALTPFFYRFYSTNTLKNFISTCIRMSIYAIPTSCLLIAVDSIYYRGFEEFLADPQRNLVITPLNFFLYNSNSDNLANHGLHQRWLHFLINIPLLFGLHSVFIYHDIYRLILKRERCNVETFSLLACTIVPLLVLSAFPHQEPRFLLPLIVPFAVRNGRRLLQTDRSSGMWYAFNIYMFLFFAFMHQAGVLPMQMHTYENGKTLFFHTYMPPRHLIADEAQREIIDLKEASAEVLEEALQKHHEGYIVFPAGVHPMVTRALENCYCTTIEGITRYPHVATEYLPAVLQRCGFDFNCLLYETMNIVRLRFRCDLVL